MITIIRVENTSDRTQEVVVYPKLRVTIHSSGDRSHLPAKPTGRQPVAPTEARPFNIPYYVLVSGLTRGGGGLCSVSGGNARTDLTTPRDRIHGDHFL